MLITQKKSPSQPKKKQPEQKVARLKRKAVFHPAKITCRKRYRNDLTKADYMGLLH